MPILKKDIPAPVLPEQRVVPVPELGGDVIVRPLMLSARLALANDSRNKPADFVHIARLLSYAVVDGEGNALFTTSEWETWGATHIDAVMALWDVAFELSGLGGEPEKNLQAQTSSSP